MPTHSAPPSPPTSAPPSADLSAPSSAPSSAPQRRWPRRVAIGAVIVGALLGGALWLLGRESSLQALVRKLADASGGSVVVSGVAGSLYGAMHVEHIVYRTPWRRITADQVDIDWAPWRLLAGGIAIDTLHAGGVRVETLRAAPPADKPASLAPPFALSLNTVRIDRLTLADATATAATTTTTAATTTAATSSAAVTTIERLHFGLSGNRQAWQLRDASAVTPWGLAAADAHIDAAAPFKLAASASLTQAAVPAGHSGARLSVRAGGDLDRTTVAASGQSGKASGVAALVLAPYAPVPLRALSLQGKGIDPGQFNAALPTADLSVTLTADVNADRSLTGSVSVLNAAPGTLDRQRWPLRAFGGTLGGSLASLRLTEVLLDLGAAGKFTGSGALRRNADEQGPNTATFALHTDGIDLQALHSRLRRTRIAGDLELAGAGAAQTIDARLAEGGLRLDVQAGLAGQVLQLRQARLTGGAGSLRMTGSLGLAGARPLNVSATAKHFNPAALGSYGAADLNADIHASGALAPPWQVAADFALRPSRLLDLPLSGKGRLRLDAGGIEAVDAGLALGRNSVALAGSFGAPDAQLTWRIDGKQLSAARTDLYGALAASGVVTGGMAAPRTSFVVDARGLGWDKAGRAAGDGALHAAGQAWLDAARTVLVKANGSAQRVNPAAFGAFPTGSINGDFDASGQAGPDWRAALNLLLRPSTLANAALSGHVKLNADARHLSGADLALRLGPNLIAATGGFGGGSADQLAWRIDAPRLDVLGADYGGLLRGSGTLSGSMALPALTATLDGQGLKFGAHQLKTLRASASVAGGSTDGPLLLDLALDDYAHGATRVAQARLQTSGTRANHSLKLAARNDDFNATAELRGGWNADAWSGVIASLHNQGRYPLALQAPASLRVAAPAGGGVAGLAHPEQLTLGAAVFKLAAGTLSLQSLDKSGARWRSQGTAAGIALDDLAQYWPALRENVSGDLRVGAQWAVDLRAGDAAPVLNGAAHLFRERGDLTVGAEVPVVLGLRQLDLRADATDGALRLQMEVDGARAGHARLDASARLRNGRIANDSPLTLAANADMASIAWLAPLSGQPALELGGALKLALSGAGTVGAPTLNGSMEGERLALRWAEQGVKLRNGQLRAELAGDQLLLRRLNFDGEQGKLATEGTLRFVDGETGMALKLTADKLEILSRPDRTLVVSGQSTLVRDARHFTLEGRFRADRALIELAPQDRPTLSDDVIVLGRAGAGAPAKAAPAVPLTIDLEADLGDAFRLRGMGIDADLTGSVRIRAAGGRTPRANGSIRVGSGTYAAYGQKLTIERGVLTFSGAYDNPALSILAVRKRPEGEPLSETNVEAGVELRGTALAPAAKLVATPSVPDSEKLAWLVLGHGMDATSGKEAGVLGAAAGALLGGSSGRLQARLASTLGVDELGLAQAKGLETTVVTVGKRISTRAYLSFEQGATTASSLVKLRYKLNPRVTLQFQTGTNTALDMLYSWAFD